MKVEILSLSRDMVGNVAEVRAEILEDMGSYWRVKDTLRVNVEGGAHMSDNDLKSKVLEAYGNV